MPNWCYNQEVIAGPKEQVKPLYDNLVKWIHDDVTPNSFNNGWLGNIVWHAGLEEDINTATWKHHCRGELVDEFDYSENDNKQLKSCLIFNNHSLRICSIIQNRHLLSYNIFAGRFIYF